VTQVEVFPNLPLRFHKTAQHCRFTISLNDEHWWKWRLLANELFFLVSSLSAQTLYGIENSHFRRIHWSTVGWAQYDRIRPSTFDKAELETHSWPREFSDFRHITWPPKAKIPIIEIKGGLLGIKISSDLVQNTIWFQWSQMGARSLIGCCGMFIAVGLVC